MCISYLMRLKFYGVFFTVWLIAEELCHKITNLLNSDINLIAYLIKLVPNQAELDKSLI